MTRILAALAASAAFIVAAHAGEVEGTVKSVDQTTRTITMDDGKAYVATDSVDLAKVTEGAKVKVVYDDGTMNAIEVEAK